MSHTIRVAAAAYPIDWHDHWDSYADKLQQWVEAAAQQGAKLLVFPEYGAMELASLADEPALAGDLQASIQVASAHFNASLQLQQQLCEQYDLSLLSASQPLILAPDRVVNRCCFLQPGQLPIPIDKHIMTRFEREQWIVHGANTRAPMIETPFARIGVLVCYDSEFPLLGRALCEQGAELLLVPSCTDSLKGYHRVRIGAQARALENQCYVVHSPTVGMAPWSPAVDENYGAAAVYGPPDLGFNDDGIEAIGTLNQPGWVYADLDMRRVERVRREGHVLNFQHWTEQSDFL